MQMAHTYTGYLVLIYRDKCQGNAGKKASLRKDTVFLRHFTEGEIWQMIDGQNKKDILDGRFAEAS